MSTPSARTGGSLDAWFKISQRGSTVRQEVVAGLTTFLAMVYSVIVVPGMLGKAGFPPAAVFVATCLVAGLGSIVMGLWANLPLAIGCAISLTAFTAFSLVLGQHISVPVALGAVFLMGVLFTVISATGIRSWILRNLPHGVAHGTGIGIGLFLLLIAANGVGLVIKNPLDGLPVPPEQWSYADGSVTVQAVPFHEYTVSFLAYLIWDPVHMYNATTNGWTNFEHQITFDVRQPKTHKYSKIGRAHV